MKDPRDRVIDAARDVLRARGRRAVLATAMRLRQCERAAGKGDECYIRNVDDETDYCASCRANGLAAEERRELKKDERRAFARLRSAEAALLRADHSERYLPMFESNRRAS